MLHHSSSSSCIENRVVLRHLWLPLSTCIGRWCLLLRFSCRALSQIFKEVLHSNSAGQNTRFDLYQRECILAGTVDSNESVKINHKFTLRVSVSGLLPMRTKVRNPWFRKPSLKNQLLFRR